ncbi:hypothetical protein LWI28_009443 [Acer negundo]|uniref:Reverse transcriptase Ty1/copia-type domain-containing protein n=1 Tax=Acer negundo TaxID=4023 RepID=A0AAD5NTH2_ACENE|nr:hypothetical protein LWI28_009443 [Acer negundo]
MAGPYVNWTSTMLSYKAGLLKRCTWLNLQASLIQIILRMFANCERLFMDSSRLRVHGTTSCVNFSSHLDLRTHMLTLNYSSLKPVIVATLAQRFSLKDFGDVSFFRGVEVVPYKHGILLSQKRYIMDLLTCTNMTGAKPVQTPLPTSPPLSLHSGTSLGDPTTYRNAVSSLQYLSLTRLDISFAINKLSQFIHQPTTDHWDLMKIVLQYLCGTLDEGILLYRDSPITLHAFSDADWAGTKMTILPQVLMLCISAAIPSLGAQRNKTPLLTHPRRLSIAWLPPPLPS